ncbi:hypothetical protein PHYSODRAFT_492132 [Phytophthora sojae]|uniref:Uncharacterized protein n=1 Tax=Phytophthora sojae (strain P6497) TaxID=1094619 RepID=G4Z8Y9_PHYSP|nr:hypothetical protein PHYSODRAFT_492132 [Phytophthora sojae]EGZ19760.1 hypothetical protein PHYSODRAFT_492132 [Phytophthora sojae]|eukprot:XP_009522477.1 hypothetical protein PHYSODRAFT_492132 [Phytophthora sojae]
MKELDRSGELLALCYREQWAKASKLLSDEDLTEVLMFLLNTARRDFLKINTSVQKDGKTLLHLALESHNLRFVHALLNAGADVSVADKKGVRPMDLMTWTAIVHPTIMRTSALNETTASMERDEQNLIARAQEIQEDVAAARAFRAEVEEQIRRAQDTDRELATQIEAEDVKLQWIRGEVARLHTQNGSADMEVARINDETQRLTAASAALRVKHQRQEQGRSNVAAQRAIKCEAIGLLRQFPGNEALQTRALRALLVIPNGSEFVRTWRTKELVEALLSACTSVEAESPTILSQAHRCTADVLTRLKATPHAHDCGGKGKCSLQFGTMLLNLGNVSALRCDVELHEILNDATQKVAKNQITCEGVVKKT